VDETSSKKVVKAFYLAVYLSEDDYLEFLQAIDDRNKLSYLYANKSWTKSSAAYLHTAD
jgi:hypothetical protein